MINEQERTDACFHLRIAALFLLSCGSQYFREMILNDIRKARELYSGEELAAELSRIQQRLDNVECLSVDIVINLLLTYRDIQVRFFDSLLGGQRWRSASRSSHSAQAALRPLNDS